MNLFNKTAVTIVRYLFALGMLVFGLNKFFSFMAMPEFGGLAGQVMQALMDSGLMSIVGLLEVVIGLMLLFNWYTPFAIVLAAPLTVNFVLFHALVMPAGIGGAILFFVLNIYLGGAYWDSYRPMFEKN